MTATIQPYPEQVKVISPQIARSPSTKSTSQSVRSISARVGPEGLPSPTTAKTIPHLQRWNHPRSNLLKVLATFWSFVVLGANDAAYGALIPYMEVYYHVDYTVISLVFLSPLLGYAASALSNNMIHNKLGQRGVATIMSLSHIIAYTVICLHPPYPVLVVVFVLAGFGNGLGDSGWNAWIGDMANANEVLGFLHGFYGLGATLSPLIATTLVTKAGWQWYEFYYLMVGAACIEAAVLIGMFWKETGAVFREHHADTENESDIVELRAPRDGSDVSTPRSNTSATASPAQARVSFIKRLNPFRDSSSKTTLAIKNRVTLLASLFLLFYVGAEVSIGGWIVSFMLRVRGGSPFASGLTATGFWLGVTVGRFVLGFVTARLFPTEKYAVTFYLIICIGLQLMFWLIPNFIVSAVMVGLLGFFLAPMFPAAVVALTKLLPKRLHVAAVGFAAAVGASGATILPFAIGAIANSRGVGVLQPVVLALFVAIAGVWILIPKLPKQRMA